MRLKATAICTFLLFLLTVSARGQQWKNKNYSLGYRVFEVDAVGNNPHTIGRMLKDPAPHQRQLDAITYNTLNGNPGILTLHTLYLNGEWQKTDPLLRFWKKYTVQAGLLLTARIRQGAGSIGDVSWYRSTDTVLHRNMYALTKNLQFLGATIGLNRRLTLSKNLKFLIGLHAQGSFATTHYFEPRWDSSTFKPSRGWHHKITTLPTLQGKNYFQWQAMVPLGLEYGNDQKKLGIRLEVAAGLFGNRYRPKYHFYNEAHGAGIWLLYKPGGGTRYKKG